MSHQRTRTGWQVRSLLPGQTMVIPEGKISARSIIWGITKVNRKKKFSIRKADGGVIVERVK